MFFSKKSIVSMMTAALMTVNTIPVSYAQSVQAEQSVEVSVASTQVPSTWTELDPVGAEAIDLPATYVDRNLNTGAEILRPYYFINFEALDDGAYPQAIMSYVTKQIFSKDGKKFLVARNVVDELYEYNIETQQIRLLHDDIQCNTAMDAFVTADQKVYLIGNDNTVYCVDWNGEPPYKKYKVAKLPRSLSGIHVTGDGRYINGNNSGRIIRFDMQNLNSDGVAAQDLYKTYDFGYNPNSQNVGHNQVNPADPDIMFFCHEGTTTLIPDRLWIYNMREGEAYNTFRQSYNGDGTTGEGSGHEVWSESGEYLYFVKYNTDQSIGQTGIVRIPFNKTGEYNENGYPILEDSGEREYINGDYSFWHMFPAGNDKWAVGDINKTTWGDGAKYGGVRVALVSTLTHESFPLVTYAPAFDSSHPNQPHARISHGGESVAWQMSLHNADGSVSPNVGVGYMDITDITSPYANSTIMKGSLGSHTMLKWRNTANAPSDVAKDGSYQKTSANLPLYLDIADSIVKDECVLAKATVTYFDRGSNPVKLIYSSGVRTNKDLHRFNDKAVLLPKTGTNTEKTVTVDLGYVNFNNIGSYATDFQFVTDDEATYIKSVNIETYDEHNYDIDFTRKNYYYSVAERYTDLYSGIKTLHNSNPQYGNSMFDVNTTSEEIMLDAGIPQETIDYAKNNSVQYVANGSDGAWNYADVTDSAGVTKTAWFTTRYARKSGSKFEISGGNIYFSVDTPDINANTNDISVAITYLDNSASDITVGYTSTDTADGLSGVTIPRSNTGKWVTSTFSLTDSTASITNSKTKLADGKADFKFNGGANFYIADIAITVNEDNKMTDNTLYVQDISYYKADSGNKTSDWLMSTTVSPQVTVVNKNADSVKAMLFAIVETNKGVRKSFAVSNMVSVPANGSALISATNDLPVGKWQSVRYSVITSNLKPIPIPEDDVINTVATYSGNTVTLKWDSYGEGYTYDVYRDGVLLSDGFNYTGTEYVDQDVASGRHVYQVRVKVDTALRKYYYGNYVAINVE